MQPNAMKWRDAVLVSLRAFCARHGTRAVDRQTFLAEELDAVVAATASVGLTPQQTLSRHLQELRGEGLVQFLGNGNYLLLDSSLDAESEDLPAEALDLAIQAGRLRLGRVETEDRLALSRRRKGQDRVRALSLDDYGGECAVCDVEDPELLIASHILRWADAPEQRGELANVLCLCRFHDALFERGYWSLTDELKLVKRSAGQSRMVAVVLDAALRFRPPRAFPPNPAYLRQHRSRSQLTDAIPG
jgi:hypothetical protein